MNVLLLILGLLLVLLSLIDALWTALWVDGGAGPVTNQITNGVWWVMIKLIRTKRNHRLSLAGPMIQTVTVFVWVGLLWAGWLLMFSADSTSLVYARTPEPQPGNLIDRIYFVAFTISTMGNGDIYPSRGGWEIVASFATLSGMLLITMVVSFLLSVIGGVTTKSNPSLVKLPRPGPNSGAAEGTFVLKMFGYGKGPFFFRAWNLQLMSITSQLGTLTGNNNWRTRLLHRYHGALL